MTNTTPRRLIRVGTRDSQLARLQTTVVTDLLSSLFPDIAIETIGVTTRGDKILDRPIADLGTRGVFVKELEESLLDEEVDLVVHSLKDLPTDMPENLALAAVLSRQNPHDVLVSRNGQRFSDLPHGSSLATSSRRRAAQLRALRSDLAFVDMRGNINTRLRKLDEGQCDAMILAAAGLERLGMHGRITEELPYEISTPAAGQGALALECLSARADLLGMLKALDDPVVRAEITSERVFLDRLGGGCSVPIGAFARWQDGKLTLTGCVAALDGSKVIRSTAEDAAPLSGEPGAGESAPDYCAAVKLGERLACEIVKLGAEEILATLRSSTPNTVSAP